MGLFVVTSQPRSFIQRIISHHWWQPIDIRQDDTAPVAEQPQPHLKIFSCEELNSHDGEDEPEDDTDHQHIEDTGDCLDQGVDNNLREKMLEVSL